MACLPSSIATIPLSSAKCDRGGFHGQRWKCDALTPRVRLHYRYVNNRKSGHARKCVAGFDNYQDVVAKELVAVLRQIDLNIMQAVSKSYAHISYVLTFNFDID
jgi:hypothetical protein